MTERPVLGLGFDEEQQELRRSARSYLTRHSDEERVREVMATATGFDVPLWKGLAQQLGCHGLTVDERLGGAGASLVEQGIVFEELGRSLACVPYFATIALGLDLLRACAGAAPAELVDDAVARIAAGDLVTTVALVEPGGGWNPDGVRMAATPLDGQWALTGAKTFVPDGHLAELLLVVARIDDDLAVFAVDAEAPGLVVHQLAVMDQTRRQAGVELSDTPAVLLADGAGDLVARSLQRAAALLAVEQVGAAQRMLDGTVEYVKIREQFGAPVGSFQAVKHRLADVLSDVEAARSAAYYAVVAAAEDGDELLEATSMAKAFCSDALVRTAAATVQLHGGIGLTWEHWAHLYLKRARSSAVLLGSAQEHRERLAAAIGL